MNLEQRDLCVRCLRARSMCFCTRIKSFRPNFKLILLQHPRERKNTIGTARLTHLCVEDSMIIHGSRFEADPYVTTLLSNHENYCVVLYPGAEAFNLSEGEVSFTTAVKNRKLVVFVVDGTWALAKGMLRRSPRLLALPQICFTPTRLSRYIVRRQPKDFCLSTIEAVYELISLIDPKTDASVLLDTFSHLVEQQVERTHLEAEKGANIRMLLRKELPRKKAVRT